MIDMTDIPVLAQDFLSYMDTIKGKYGEPDFVDYNEKNTHYYYEVPNMSTEQIKYGVSFVFDAQGILKTVNYGDFDPIYLR